MKKVGNILVDILIVLVVVAALAMSVMVISSKATGVPNVLGYSPVTVQTDSMLPTFNVGDLVIIKKGDTTSFEVNDIITFKMIVGDKEVLNTHRIVEKINAGGLVKYKTQGDNVNQEDINAVVNVDVIGKYTGYKVAGVGKVLDFIKTQNGILICFVIPLALLFIWQLYKFIMLIAENKKQKEIEAVTSTLEEEKQKAIEEYIAQQKAAEEAKRAVNAIPPIVGDGSSVPDQEMNPTTAEADETEETPVVGDGSSVPDEETNPTTAEADETEETPVVGDGSSVPDEETNPITAEADETEETPVVGNDPCVVPEPEEEIVVAAVIAAEMIKNDKDSEEITIEEPASNEDEDSLVDECGMVDEDDLEEMDEEPGADFEDEDTYEVTDEDTYEDTDEDTDENLDEDEDTVR